jgi:glycosyltransferase involved in cell wall biosynthesis
MNDTTSLSAASVGSVAKDRTALLKMIVVGQTPPPFGGQAIMLQRTINLHIPGLEMHHVRMHFSHHFGEAGRMGFRKVIEGLKVILSIVTTRLRRGAQVLYYPPAGPNLVPILRDLVILISTRWMFQRVVLHFHASGLAEFLERSSPVLRFLARWAYDRPDLAIEVAHGAPREGAAIRAKRSVVVWNGVEDAAADFPPRQRSQHRRCKVLFAGILFEDKGVIDLIDACAILANEGVDFECELMGDPRSEQMQERLVARIENHGLTGHVRLLGVLTGATKWQTFHEADIFCFPTYYASESFPLVALEAMSFGLPVVATTWRGLADIVTDEVGIAVPIRDAGAIAAALSALIHDPQRREKLGAAGRRRYVELFTMKEFERNLSAALLSLQQNR